jgi:glycosyltransferase involved in cell wall biosynthesis
MSSRRLTILQVLPALESGGVERGTLEVAAELTRRGHRSLVISAGGRLVPPLLAAGSGHLSWDLGRKSPLTARWVLPLRRLIERERVDLVHARSRVPAWVAWLAWRSLPPRRRPRFLTTAHGLYSVNAFSAIMTRGERVIAISQTVRDYLTRHYPRLPPERIRLIPRGVDPGEFPHGYRPSDDWRAQWQAQYPALRDRTLITLPGRLTRLKGHAAFLHLVDRLRKRDPSIHALVVGGEDPQRRAYAREVYALARSLGLDQHVTFTGYRSDIRDIFAISNVVVSMTADPPEAFGRTVLEPLALGVPVVGYDCAGTGEILRALFPQGAVPAGSLEEMEKTVLRILRSGADVPANRHFTQRNMLDATMQVYEELAA